MQLKPPPLFACLTWCLICLDFVLTNGIICMIVWNHNVTLITPSKIRDQGKTRNSNCSTDLVTLLFPSGKRITYLVPWTLLISSIILLFCGLTDIPLCTITLINICNFDGASHLFIFILFSTV